MKVGEIKPRASEGDVIELEGKVSFAKKPNSRDFEGTTVWSQFVVLKDDTGEQGAWLKLDSPEDKVSKGSSIKIKGKLGEEYEDNKGVMKRSINNCELIGKTQAPAQSSSTPKNGNGTKDNYWEKKFIWDQKVHFSIVRECAIKAVTELAKIDPKKITMNIHTEHDYFRFADTIVDYICRKLKTEDITKEFGGTKEEAKEEKIEKAREVVGKTEFKPASTKQKNIIFGYKGKEGKWKKGMIESRYIETEEIKEIGDPKKLSVEEAGKWIEFWWGEEGNPDDIGARKQREIDNPRDENGTPVDALVKGDKTSVAKDILVDEIYALRRENRLNDDDKFKEVMGYNPKIEELTEAECTKLKGLLKNYVPF